jgi:hypothetical protein
MAVHPEPDRTHETPDESDTVGLNRQERRSAGKQAKSTAKIPTRGQYGVAVNHRQYAHRRRG